MPLLGDDPQALPSQPMETEPQPNNSISRTSFSRKQSQHSGMAKTAIMNHHSPPSNACSDDGMPTTEETEVLRIVRDKPLPSKTTDGGSLAPQNQRAGHGAALTDTPASTAPNSPKMPPRRQDSTSTTASRCRPTTLDIPGLTKSRVSPDGRIAQRDVGSKLVIVMVGLPARGKSYITKKITRYLNWLQHDTRIFNVGERRREAAHGQLSHPPTAQPGARFQPSASNGTSLGSTMAQKDLIPPPALDSEILINGQPDSSISRGGPLPTPALGKLRTDSQYVGPPGDFRIHAISNNDANPTVEEVPISEPQDQSAQFFDPENASASKLREHLAMATLDELLDYILDQGGSVGIFDATNSTLERRKLIMDRIRQRAGPELGVLFLESLCIDENLLESNMRLKLSGPDYKDQDPVAALADFKKRVSLYEKKYVPLGEHEERNNMPYIQMIDVGRKVVSHQIRGFLSAQTVYYLLNFNLAARQIWITRHGESLDNVNGKIGGDSDLSEVGLRYGKALTNFIKHERGAWEAHQQFKAMSTHFPPRPGDTTPPNPEYTSSDNDNGAKSFCVWTSMLKRSIQTAQFFDEEDFDVKQMRMLDELNAGSMEGLTYEEIKSQHQDEYELRRQDKLHYRYPGAGGEGYLDIINRLRAVIVEIERMTDHVLLVGHRSVARVLLAYFKGLNRNDVADLDVPLGILYMLEPKPYGVEFKAYRYNPESEWFDVVPDYQLRRAPFQTSY